MEGDCVFTISRNAFTNASLSVGVVSCMVSILSDAVPSREPVVSDPLESDFLSEAFQSSIRLSTLPWQHLQGIVGTFFPPHGGKTKRNFFSLHWKLPPISFPVNRIGSSLLGE